MSPVQDGDQKLNRPVRVSGTHEYRLGDELLVYVPHSETAHALNPSAVAIWELCDGTRTAEDISRELGHWLGRPGEALLPDTRRGIAELCELGLLEVG
jgi:pyrroloquinoline quinone biosynthesis protein D